MRASNPKITVLLTTYSRPYHLSMAIKSVLNQDFKDYELLVLDDASPDNTEDIVKSFKDKRIKYIKNKINHGFPYNFRQGVTLAKGGYIFLLSDDDLILKPDTLTEIYKKVIVKNIGFAELSVLFYEESPFKPSFLAPPGKTDQFYVKSSKNIFFKLRNWHLGFASGNIYKKDLIRTEDIIEDVWFSHVKPIYRIVKKFGAYYFGDHYILAKYSKVGNVSYLNIGVNKGFHIKKLFRIYREFDSSKKNNYLFQKMHLDGVVSTFPGIKYYTSNENIIAMAKEILKINKKYYYNISFWIIFFASLLTPKVILNFFRGIKLKKLEQQSEKITRNANLQRHLELILK